MPKKKIKLPSKLTKDSWFYKDNKEICEPHLGKYYISYSSAESWESYREDFIKKKFAKIKIPSSIYGAFGTYVGEAVEHGKFDKENPYGFTGQGNLDLDSLRPSNGEYEKMILIDRGEFVILGFIDRYHEIKKDVAHITDFKTGGAKKEAKYQSDDYVQVVLYAHAIEQTGKEIGATDVWFVRRTGSHKNPPMHISEEQFEIPLVYNEERVKFALDKIDRIVNEISDCYHTYLKIFE